MKTIKLISFAILTVITFQLSGQVVDGVYEKLAKLYNAGRFEDCFYKAENFTLSDKSKKDPEPYLYASMCMLELSESDDPFIQEEFKKAAQTAVKFAGKFAKKDKDDILYTKNIEFITKVKKLQLGDIKVNIKEKNYRKAASGLKYYNAINREIDYSVLYFQGMCEVLSNNLSQGEKNIDEATTNLRLALDAGKIKYDQVIKSSVVDAFSTYMAYLIENNQKEKAKTTLKLAKEVFPDAVFAEIE